MSTSGGIQYIGGIPCVHRENIMSTSGGYRDTCGGYHEYMGGCSVHGGIPWVHRGGYHEYIGGISWVHRGDIMSTSGFSIEIERILSSCSPTCIMISLRCTEHPPMYSWYPPNVLMISPRCTEHPPIYWTSPDVWTHIMNGNKSAAKAHNPVSLVDFTALVSTYYRKLVSFFGQRLEQVYSLSPGFWQSFISIEVCRDCIPALASSCKKQLTGFFVCLLFFLKVKRIS